MRGYTTSAIGLIALITIGCGATTPVRTAPQRPAASVMSQLWVDPGPVPRELVYGVGGRRFAPPPDAEYTFVAKDEVGFSTSFDVTSPDGMEWSAKIGPEAQTEVFLSRILWALGYHQPPVYYLPSWKIAGKGIEAHRESEARFRPKIPTLVREKEYWNWAENQFSGTRELKGLLVTLLVFNSTDLKDDNNSIYTSKERWDGHTRWFVVRDIGAALGETGKLFPQRNCLECFEKQGFITRIEGDRVEFDYSGRHQELLSMITPEDVRWAAQRLNRLTAQQWREAFRTANYADPIANRYLARIRQKIDDGLALRARPADDRATN